MRRQASSGVGLRASMNITYHRRRTDINTIEEEHSQQWRRCGCENKQYRLWFHVDINIIITLNPQ